MDDNQSNINEIQGIIDILQDYSCVCYRVTHKLGAIDLEKLPLNTATKTSLLSLGLSTPTQSINRIISELETRLEKIS